MNISQVHFKYKESHMYIQTPLVNQEIKHGCLPFSVDRLLHHVRRSLATLLFVPIYHNFADCQSPHPTLH